MLGGPFVGPWDINELPDEWLDVFRAVAVDLPGMREGKARVNERLEKWRSGNV
jgi:hypothetical protein